MKNKNMKRILSVTIKREMDSDPDTSYLGEYVGRGKSDYTIDRRHTAECASVEPNADRVQQMLEHARGTVAEYQALEPNSDTLEWIALDDAYSQLDELSCEIDDCDCGGMRLERNSFEYFEPNWENYKGLPEEEIRKYCRQDYERMESLNNQNWYYLGIVAEAKVSSGNHVQTFTSSCWGIESDSDKSFFVGTENDILAELKDQLSAWGFSKRAISTAFKNVEHTEE